MGRDFPFLLLPFPHPPHSLLIPDRLVPAILPYTLLYMEFDPLVFVTVCDSIVYFSVTRKLYFLECYELRVLF